MVDCIILYPPPDCVVLIVHCPGAKIAFSYYTKFLISIQGIFDTNAIEQFIYIHIDKGRAGRTIILSPDLRTPGKVADQLACIEIMICTKKLCKISLPFLKMSIFIVLHELCLVIEITGFGYM